jgi:uncharacterized membrane protein
MDRNRQHRAWVVVAVIAVGLALVVLTIPGHSGNDVGFVPLIPLLLVGIISPLSLLSPLSFRYIGHTPEAPALSVIFQRPPPTSRHA